ncbi:G-protein coupled receptor moody-like [Anticarsia gemmatalis]|uniref:G-protein coupled receptor moody-like n=1 Tax=Anticarsia gemmatalis TaxID=129554 RepID=UPI003F7687E7
MNDTAVNRSIGLSAYPTDADLAAVELFKDYPDSLLHFAAYACMMFMLIGIPGNLFTIIALARCKKVRNATAIFIINLSVSDLLFCCFILPLAALTFKNQAWTHGKVLCHMFPYVRYALVAVSLLSVLAITINRYIMISHPSLYPKIYTSRYLSMMIACLWAFPFGILIPTCLEVWGKFSLDTVTGSCTIIPDDNDNSPKKFLFIIGFILPSLAIIFCYARVWWIVKETTKLSRRPKPTTEMKTLNMSTMTITKSADFDAKRPSRNTMPQFPFTCFLQTGAEISSSCDSTGPDAESRYSTPEDAVRALGSEPKNFRRSFIATMKWSTVPKPKVPTKKDKKLLTMIVAIMVAFFVCHLPITLTKTVFLEFTSHPYPNIIGYVLIYFTTCVNPVIYVVMSSEYRQAYKNLMKCRR